MKRLLGVSVLALVLAAVAAPRADAWANFHLGVGFDLSYQSGNNRWLWGLLRNGPTGVEYPNWAYGPIFDQWGNFGGLNSNVPPPGYYGGYPAHDAASPGVTDTPPSWTAPAPTPGKSTTPNSGQKSTYFQPVAYPYADYSQFGYSYGAPSYYGAAYYQAPSYWYGR